MSGPPPLNYETPAGPQPRVRFSRGLAGWLIFVAVAALLFVWLKQANSVRLNAIPLSNFYAEFTAGNVATAYIGGDEIDGRLVRPTPIGGTTVSVYRTYLPQGTTANWTFTKDLIDHAPPATVISAEPQNTVLTNIILPLIPWVLIFAFIWFFVFRQLRKNQAARPTGPTPVVIVNPEAR